MATDKTDETPPPDKPLSQWKRRQQRLKKIAATSAGVTASLQGTPARFKVGSRPRSLDPDQATLDKNLKTILGAGAMNCTMEETAALHDVAPSTLALFFTRYPEIRERFDDARLTGAASIKRNQFNLSAKSPQMAVYLGEQILGQRDPYKMADLDRKREEFDKFVEIENEKLALRERDVKAKERLLEMRMPTDLGAGLPIDIKSLSLQQLIQLADRIRQALNAGGGLTIDAVSASAEPEKTG